MYSSELSHAGVFMPKSFHETTAPEISASFTRSARSSSESPSRLDPGLIDSNRFPFRRTAAASASFSFWAAKNEGMCSPNSPTWCGAWLELSPAAPAWRASSTIPTIASISSSVAARSSASSPMT